LEPLRSDSKPMATSAHFAASLVILADTPLFPGKEDKVNQGCGDPKDEVYAWSLAVNFKSYIDKQRAEGTQGSNFLDIVNEFEEEGGKRRRDDKVVSCSQWTKQTLIPFQIYFVPMVNWNAIIPQEYIHTREELEAQFGDVFNPTYNEAFLSNYGQIAKIPSKPLRQLFAVIYILLKKNPQSVQTTVSAEELDAREDKKEVMTDALFRKVAEHIGINDPADSPLVLVEQRVIKAHIGRRRHYTSINEFVVVNEEKYHTGPVLAFAEDKRLILPTLKSLPDTISQKAGESLAVALEGFLDSGVLEKDQEVFCVGVRHRFFSFWHTVFTGSYLRQVSKDAGALKPEHFTCLKMYPVSEYGLDICDPAQRLLIFQAMVAIKEYVSSGKARIGKY